MKIINYKKLFLVFKSYFYKNYLAQSIEYDNNMLKANQTSLLLKIIKL